VLTETSSYSSPCSRHTTVSYPSVLLPIIKSDRSCNPVIVSSTFDFPEEEEKVLKFWREIDAFQTSLKLSEARPVFSFYDGPPFATGLPHYGHLLAGTIKVRSLSLPQSIHALARPPEVFVLLIRNMRLGGCGR